MIPDLTNIDYLLKGSAIQQLGWYAIRDSGVLNKLRNFNPVLTGTLPLDLFIVGKSDLDIICEPENLAAFYEFACDEFSSYEAFEINILTRIKTPSIVIRFRHKDFLFEIFAQCVPVEKQYAYRHLRAEFGLLLQHGETLKTQVLTLKKSGIKTEPAFAQALNLAGDPYESILQFDISTFK